MKSEPDADVFEQEAGRFACHTHRERRCGRLLRPDHRLGGRSRLRDLQLALSAGVVSV